jgi:hypothetical protein
MEVIYFIKEFSWNFLIGSSKNDNRLEFWLKSDNNWHFMWNLHTFLREEVTSWGFPGQLLNCIEEFLWNLLCWCLHPAKQSLDTLPTQRPLTPGLAPFLKVKFWWMHQNFAMHTFPNLFTWMLITIFTKSAIGLYHEPVYSNPHPISIQ